MRRNIFFLLLFILLGAFEFSFVSSLGYPLRFIPVLLVVGIWLYQHKQENAGLWYIVGWGIWQDLSGIQPWTSATLGALFMVGAAIYLSKKFFQHRSIYGLLGMGFSLLFLWTVFEGITRFFSATEVSIAFSHFWVSQLFMLVSSLLLLSILFYEQQYVKHRFR